MNKIKEELLKGFESEQLNREEVLFMLSNQTRNKGESAHKQLLLNSWNRLLAYPDFDDLTLGT